MVLTNSNHPEFISELIRSVALSYAWDDFVPTYKKMELDEAELKKISGRYRINNGNLIQVYQSGNQLFRKNLGMEPVELFKISDNTYISQKDERPLRFNTNPENENMELLVLNPNNETVESTHPQMTPDEKLPVELLQSGDFEQALNAYKTLMKADEKDPAITENNLNRLGYRFMNSENLKLAKDIFKVNMILYPESFNVYDSYAEACMNIGELDLAVENYERSLALNPENTNAVKMLEELQKRKQKNADSGK